VDYMAEHLTPGGRAGVIVPEGIIFQSHTAYKQLRKMLVEQYLVAVVSLPAGVFNPYSGVKTSILILDKSLARQSDTVGFFKVENDGFNLGAQRRPIDRNDLPAVLEGIKNYQLRITNKEDAETITAALSLVIRNSQFVIVPKARLAANGDYNLSGERYREGGARSHSFPHLTLGEVCDVNPEQADPAERYADYFSYIDISCVDNGSGKFLGANRTDVAEAPSRARRVVQARDVLLSTVRPNLKAFAFITDPPDRAIASTGFALLRAKQDRLLPEFLIQMVRHESAVNQMVGMMGKGAYPSINQTDVEAIEIPLPPLSVQEEIVGEIEGYQKVSDGARAVLDHYRPHIPIQPDWPMVELGEVCEINPKKSEVDGLPGETVVSFVPMADLGEHSMTFEPKDAKPLGEVGASYTYFRDNDVLIAKVTPCFENGKAGIARNLSNRIGFGSSEFFVIRCSEKILPEWAYFTVATPAFRATATEKMTGTGGLQRVPRAVLEEQAIPLPPLPVQQKIVAEIEAERTLVEANRQLIARMEAKIAAVLARIWGDEIIETGAGRTENG